MRMMTEDMVRTLLGLLRDAADTSMDGMRLWADTDWDRHVIYNPYMNGGEWEIIETDTGNIIYASSMDAMVGTIMEIDGNYIRSITGQD